MKTIGSREHKSAKKEQIEGRIGGEKEKMQPPVPQVRYGMETEPFDPQLLESGTRCIVFQRIWPEFAPKAAAGVTGLLKASFSAPTVVTGSKNTGHDPWGDLLFK